MSRTIPAVFRHKRHGTIQPVPKFLVCVLLLVVAGCSGGLGTNYGSSKGYSAKRSINGFTTFRTAFTEAGFYDREFNRLTDRARMTSVVVWTPGHPSPIDVRTTRWFESWLGAGYKTLIFVVPDSGSESQFYSDARPVASPGQRLEYRRKYAESLVAEHRWQTQRTAIASNGWFVVRPKVQHSQVVVADEEKSEETVWKVPSGDQSQRRFEWVIEAYDRDNPTTQNTMIWQPVGPGSPPVSFGESTVPTSTELQFAPVLKSENGDTLVARVTSTRWRNSQILVVAGGSLLTNYGLTRQDNQQLADQLISASLQPMITGNIIDPDTRLLANGSAPQVGFTSANGSMPISVVVGDIPRATGMELLTVFPISFVTFHALVLGFVICLMLLPIFGRPRQIDRGVLTHFGDHLSAVATLMRRRGGEAYAKRRISEYMTKVREESSGPWVIQSPPHPDDPALHLHVPGTPPKITIRSQPLIAGNVTGHTPRKTAETGKPKDQTNNSIELTTDDSNPNDRG
ncbi:MAG: MBL fold metallo-hydrolase [Planctomycetales bacterium]|nr:MBL fold metallo-hydrolase [Planctomycetales bacterium]